MDRLLRASQGNPPRNHFAENQIALRNGESVEITSVERTGDYSLNLLFSDGHEQRVDFQPFLTNSRNAQIRAYLQPEKFAGYRLDYGDLVWDDYELVFPIADLYEGRI